MSTVIPSRDGMHAGEDDQAVAGGLPGALRPDPYLDDGPTIDLLEVLVKFLAEWKIGLVCGLIALIGGVTYTYETPPQFVAVAVILPKQTFAESNSLTTLFSGKHPEDLYTGLLKSRSVTDNVIRELNFIPQGSTQGWEDARGFLYGSMNVMVGGDGLIRIFVHSTDAKLAMKIANAYLDGLHQQQQQMAMSQSVLNRQFFEQQLAQEKLAVTKAENELVELQKRTGIIEAGTQTQMGLGQIAGTRNAITGLEVQLAALLQSETDQNPQVRTLRTQIAALREQERTMESNGVTGTGAPTAAGRMPSVNLEFDRMRGAVSAHEGLFNSLAAQYQNALMVEASSVDAFQVVDYAIEPERKSYPPRNQWFFYSFVFSVVFGAFSIFVVLLTRRVRADADYQRHMSTIRQNFRLRKVG